ncbi:MAG: hypothetical protein B6U95_04715, partial [Thermofilum sp. ex4484_82]
MVVDKERINKLIDLMEHLGLEVIIALDKANVHYLCGAALDYSASIMTRDGRVIVVCHVLEAERAEKESWGEIFAYSSYPIESYKEYMQVNSIYEAIRRVLSKEVEVRGKFGVPFDKTSAQELHELRKNLSETDLIDVSDNLNNLRLVKTSFEIKNMKESCKVTDRVMNVALDAIHEGIR